MICEIAFKKTRKKISVWVIVFATIILILCAAFPLRALAANDPEANAQYASACFAEASTNINNTESADMRVGLTGIIIAILAAIVIISIIIFTVRSRGSK